MKVQAHNGQRNETAPGYTAHDAGKTDVSSRIGSGSQGRAFDKVGHTAPAIVGAGQVPELAAMEINRGRLVSFDN